jgi:MOSC domain-containing protein
MSGFYLSEINVYPVKSLSGFSVNHWPVENTGLRFDRQWMLIDENNCFISQRKIPRMALIKTVVHDEQLILSTPDGNHLELSLYPTITDKVEISIWHDEYQAGIVDQKADKWLSEFLGVNCRLVYQPTDSVRQVDQNYAHNGDQTAFSDGFPFLLLSEASLQSLNDAMPEALTMARFRPNLVIAGCPPYAEDSWREICINGIDFRLPKPCSRCTITTINPETAISGSEPLATLSKLRKWNNQVYFGQNALHNHCGELSIGNPVNIKQTGPAQPPL